MPVFARFAIRSKVLFFAMAVILVFVRIAGNSIYGAMAADMSIRVFSVPNVLMILQLIPIPVKSTKPVSLPSAFSLLL
jgi:hypothetical protein